MIPAELEPIILNLPPAEVCRIVVITGQELRHDRFALRLQAEFPRLVVAWLQVAPIPPASQDDESGPGAGQKTYAKLPFKLRSWASQGTRLLTSRTGRRRLLARVQELGSAIPGRLRRHPKH